MSGQAHLEVFDNLTVDDISNNEVLREAYKRSNCSNLSQFLALGENRFKISNYNIRTENYLRESLRGFLSKDKVMDLPGKSNLTISNPPPKSNTKPNSKQREETIAKLKPLSSVEKQFLDKVLDGSTRIEEFRQLTIYDITSNVRLIHVYEYSSAENLCEFLTLGYRRKDIRNYGRKSEEVLRRSIEKLISSRAVDFYDNKLDTKTHKIEERTVEHEKLILALKEQERARKLISVRLWKQICSDLQASPMAHELIASTAAELDMPWPLSVKSPYSEKTLSDYLNYSISDLLELDRFGWKKVNVYVACIIYMHKMHVHGSATQTQSVKDTVLTIWQNSRLTEKEKKVIELRFGIQDERKHTLAEIKEHFGVTRESIRQIESKALKKLRMSMHFKALPSQLIENKNLIWERLTDQPRLKKQEWMEPLEDRLGFEYQIALEIINQRKNRNRNTSALAHWLDNKFPNDETFWYKEEKVLPEKIEHNDGMNHGLLDFLNQL